MNLLCKKEFGVNKYNDKGVYMCNVDGAGKYAFNHVKEGKYLLVMVSAKTNYIEQKGNNTSDMVK